MSRTRDGKYNESRPVYPWRIPKLDKERIDSLRDRLGLNKQEFVDALYEIAMNELENRANKGRV
jgi:predicted DNA-binding protein